MRSKEWRKCRSMDKWGCDWNCEAEVDDIKSMWHIGDRVICDVCLYHMNDLLSTLEYG